MKKNALVAAQVASATALVATRDFTGAEKALVKIADNEGDKALIAALKSVPPADLGQILVATATAPTAIVGDLVSPTVFVSALLEVPKTWSRDSEADALHQLSELFLGVVMRPTGKNEKFGGDAPKFFKAIHANGDAIRLLAWWLSCHNVGEVIRPRTEEEDPHEPHEGEWDHLFILLMKKGGGLYEAVKRSWRDDESPGITFTDFLPSVEVPEADSAL